MRWLILILLLCVLAFAPQSSQAALPVEHQWRLDLMDDCIGPACTSLQAMSPTGWTLCTVSNTNNSGTGSLRNCLESTSTFWIVFALSGTITVDSPIHPKSNKVLDGRGADIVLTTSSSFCTEASFATQCDSTVLMLGDYTVNTGQAVTNIILENIKIRNVTGNAMVTVYDRASNVWVDHFDLQNPQDETIQMGQGQMGGLDVPPQNVTLSWTRFRQRDLGVTFPAWAATGCTDLNPSGNWCSKSLLISGNYTPMGTNFVLVAHHNWFQSDGRNPHLRDGRMHGWNNYHDARTITIGGGSPWTNFCGNPTWFFSENDIFDAGSPNGFDQIQPMLNGDAAICGADTGTIKATGALLLSGATLYQHNAGSVPDPHTLYTYTPATANSTLQSAITSGAGFQAINAPPYITITTDGGNGAGNNFTTSNASLSLGGTSSDTSGVGGSVSSITVTCSPSCGNPTESGTTSWSAPITLSSGANVITAMVTDNGGATWQDQITVTLAASDPPTATITTDGGNGAGVNFTTTSTPLTTLAGTGTDDVGVTSVTWSCPTCSPTSGTATCGTCGASATSVSWSVGSIGLSNGANTITVNANDGDSQQGPDSIQVTLNAVVVGAPFGLRFVQ